MCLCLRVFSIVLAIGFRLSFRVIRRILTGRGQWTHPATRRGHGPIIRVHPESSIRRPDPVSHKKEPDPIQLSFYNSCLRKSDTDLLQGPHWLNDALISFYFEYLERKVFADETDWLFVSAQTTQFIRMMPGEAGVLLDPLDASRKAFIFFALNDSQELDRAGGSHWSLLVFSRPEMAFYHFDSLWSVNLDVCRLFTAILEEPLDCLGAQLRMVSCLRQSNGYDCGLHVLCNADMAAQRIRQTGKIAGVRKRKEESIQNKRSQLQAIIGQLRERIYRRRH